MTQTHLFQPDIDTLEASGRTAMHRARPSAIARQLVEKGVLEGGVYDWGCGHGQDVAYFRGVGLQAIGWDPNFATAEEPYKHVGKYPWVLCSFVLNVLPTIQERSDVLNQIRRFLPACGRVVVVVRPQEEIDRLRKPTWRHHNDGWLTSRDTFQKGFTLDELADFVHASGFEVTRWSKNPSCVIGLKAKLLD